MNPFVHGNRCDAGISRAVSRLLIGGQFLWGGDGSKAHAVTVFNCCVWCLQNGIKRIENVQHVVFDCPEYDGARASNMVRELLLRGGNDVFILHRNRWSWRELRALQGFFREVVAIRGRLGGNSGKQRVIVQDLAELAWF